MTADVNPNIFATHQILELGKIVNIIINNDGIVEMAIEDKDTNSWSEIVSISVEDRRHLRDFMTSRNMITIEELVGQHVQRETVGSASHDGSMVWSFVNMANAA